PRGAGRQPLPLHRLPEHHPRGPARRPVGPVRAVVPGRTLSPGGSDLMTTTDAQVQAAAEVGRARVRKEDARLVTGQTNWTDNIQLPGLLHMAFARSPHAHARITRVDLSAARSMPGVVAAFSGADFAGEQGSLPCAWPAREAIVVPDHPPMAA